VEPTQSGFFSALSAPLKIVQKPNYATALTPVASHGPTVGDRFLLKRPATVDGFNGNAAGVPEDMLRELGCRTGERGGDN